MASTTDNQPGSTVVSAELRGETMAYALQSGLYNLAGNFFEPYVNYRAQKYYSQRQHITTHGNYTQNLAGEFVGDLTGSTALIAAEALAPEQLHAFSRNARRLVDPLYETAAHIVFSGQERQPDYRDKVDEWKTDQERNLVRSGIIATTGIAGNLAAQKYLIKNPSPTSVIFAGKLLSTALTTGLGLTARLAFPKQTGKIDEWVGENVFAPMMEDKKIEPESPVSSHAEKVMSENARASEPAR